MMNRVNAAAVSLLAVLALAGACGRGGVDADRPGDARANVTGGSPVAQARLLFKHHGSGDGCNTELGFCIRIPIGRAVALSDEEIAEGYGTADLKVEEGALLRMTFHRPAALPDGTIPITEAKALEPELAADLGYARVELQPGTYRVDFTRSRYGEILVPVRLTER